MREAVLFWTPWQQGSAEDSSSTIFPSQPSLYGQRGWVLCVQGGEPARGHCEARGLTSHATVTRQSSAMSPWPVTILHKCSELLRYMRLLAVKAQSTNTMPAKDTVKIYVVFYSM